MKNLIPRNNLKFSLILKKNSVFYRFFPYKRHFIFFNNQNFCSKNINSKFQKIIRYSKLCDLNMNSEQMATVLTGNLERGKYDEFDKVFVYIK